MQKRKGFKKMKYLTFLFTLPKNPPPLKLIGQIIFKDYITLNFTHSGVEKLKNEKILLKMFFDH